MGINDFGANQPQDTDIKEEMDAWLLTQGLRAAQLTYHDKQRIVKYLLQEGRFETKGAISSTANLLQVTHQCIYNYIDFAKQNQDSQSGV